MTAKSTRKVTVRRKKVESASEPRRPAIDYETDRTDSEQIVRLSNEEARKHGVDNSEPAKNLAKVVSLHVSVGDDDRAFSMDDFIRWIYESLAVVPYGQDGVHANVMSSYYIVDGKVCLPHDYDPNKENFSNGAVPPPWAGGPVLRKLASSQTPATTQRGMSRQAYDAKYGPGGSPEAARLLSRQKEVHEELKIEAEEKKMPELSMEWDESDIDNDAKHERVAKKSVRIAGRKLREAANAKKNGAKKVAVKKSASRQPRTVVRRKK